MEVEKFESSIYARKHNYMQSRNFQVLAFVNFSATLIFNFNWIFKEIDETLSAIEFFLKFSKLFNLKK